MPKNRIETSGGEELATNPFESLKKEGLKPFNSTPAKAPNKKLKKIPKSKGVVKIRKEKSGRGGKTVIVIYEMPNHVNMPMRDKLLKSMKAKLGTGGTIKIRNIEIQGDKLEAVKNFLIEDGFTVKG